jgi:hypothetical protein
MNFTLKKLQSCKKKIIIISMVLKKILHGITRCQPVTPEPDVDPVDDFLILFRLDTADGEIDGDGLLLSELQV